MTLSHETAENRAAARETMKHDVPNFFIMKIHFIGSREGGQARPGNSIAYMRPSHIQDTLVKVNVLSRDDCPAENIQTVCHEVLIRIHRRNNRIVLTMESGCKAANSGNIDVV